MLKSRAATSTNTFFSISVNSPKEIPWRINIRTNGCISFRYAANNPSRTSSAIALECYASAANRGDFLQSRRRDSIIEFSSEENLGHEWAGGVLLPAVIGRNSWGLVLTQALTVWRRLNDHGILISQPRDNRALWQWLDTREFNQVARRGVDGWTDGQVSRIVDSRRSNEHGGQGWINGGY